MAILQTVSRVTILAVIAVFAPITVASGAPSRSLTVDTGRGLPVGELQSVRISGPDGFRRTIRKPGRVTYRHLSYGTYVLKAGRVAFKRTTGNGAVAGLSATPLVSAYGGTSSLKTARNTVTLKPARRRRSGEFDVFYTSPPPPGGPIFTQLAGGGDHTCGLRRAHGIISCWGINAYQAPPAGAFTQLVDDDEGQCGLRPNGRVDCWSMGTFVPDPPATRFKRVAAGRTFGCGLKSDGSLSCWWRKDYFPASGPTLPVGRFIDVRVGGGIGPRGPGGENSWVCGLQADASVVCGGAFLPGSYGGGPYISPQGAFKHLGGGRGPCGLRSDGVPVCWGPTPGALYVQLDGAFTQFAFVPGCGVQLDRTVKCSPSLWNVDSPPLPGAFTQIAGGVGHACGLRPNGTAECWWTQNGIPNRKEVGQLDVPRI